MSASHYMTKDDNPIKSGKKSRKPVIIPLILMQYGSMKDKIKASAATKPAIGASIKGMIKSAKQLKDSPKQGKTQIDKDTLAELEQYALGLGVSQIGYTKVNPDFIIDGFEILYDNAMVITMEMEREAMKPVPSTIATAEIWRTYVGVHSPHMRFRSNNILRKKS